jgi:SAM-dependent methyltransferase
MTDPSDHWNKVYTAKQDQSLTWYQDHSAGALAAIQAHCDQGQAIIDVGGGTAHLVDDLLGAGLGPVSVLDISQAAIARSRARLGDRADQVDWQVADITDWTPGRSYAFWHDRAVFHFLTKNDDRATYVQAMSQALGAGGMAMISTFADDGPQKCSGLDVCRYAPKTLLAEIERQAPGGFDMVRSWRHDHHTPAQNVQKFQTTLLRKR